MFLLSREHFEHGVHFVATMPTVEGRPFDPSGDGAVVLRGGNVTADTRFGGLDVVQKLREVTPG